MAEPLRLAIVGFGAVARDYLVALREVESLQLAAIIDPDEEARATGLELAGVPVFGSVEELPAEAAVEAALVAVPPAFHEPCSLELIAGGISVLCEKPIASSSGAAARMCHAAARAGVTLMMASKFRYVPDVVETRRLIQEGALGDVTMFDNAFCSPVDMTERWNADPQVSGGGVLIDNGSHSVDIARFLFGPLVRVMAHFGRRTTPVRVEDTVRVWFETIHAVVGSIDLSWAIDKGAEYYIGVYGTEGVAQVGWRGSRYRRRGESEWREYGAGYDKRAAFARQLRNFAAAVRGAEKPLVTVDDAIESVRAIEAAYRSARVGRWVPLHGYDGSLS